MKIKDLTVVALRFYALMLLLDFIQGLYRLFFQWRYVVSQPDGLGKFVFIDGVTSLVVWLALGILLLVYSQKIASWVIPGSAEEGLIETDAPQLLRAGLAVAGAIVLVRGVGLLGYYSALWYFMPSDSLSRFRPDMPYEQKARFVESIICILAGLFLFLGKTRLTELVRALRRAGIGSRGQDYESGAK